MRKLRQVSMSALLALMLGAPAVAGIIGGPPEPAPQPPAVSATGTIETPPSAEPVTSVTAPIVDIALTLLQGALSLL